MSNKKDKLEITELFMAKAGKTGWDRCFHGTIKRETDADGNPVVYGKIPVGHSHIISSAKDQWQLGDRLDEMVLIVLEMGLHDDEGVTAMLGDQLYFRN